MAIANSSKQHVTQLLGFQSSSNCQKKKERNNLPIHCEFHKSICHTTFWFPIFEQLSKKKEIIHYQLIANSTNQNGTQLFGF